MAATPWFEWAKRGVKASIHAVRENRRLGPHQVGVSQNPRTPVGVKRICDLILRSALLRASRRMATGTAEQAAILRDAPLRCGAPQDEVKFFCDREFRRPVGHFRDLKYLKSGGAWSFRVGIR